MKQLQRVAVVGTFLALTSVASFAAVDPAMTTMITDAQSVFDATKVLALAILGITIGFRIFKKGIRLA